MVSRSRLLPALDRQEQIGLHETIFYSSSEISYTVESYPKLHMSALWPYGTWWNISGAMYTGVPTRVLAMSQVLSRTFHKKI